MLGHETDVSQRRVGVWDSLLGDDHHGMRLHRLKAVSHDPAVPISLSGGNFG